MMAVGVARPNAHGHAMMNTATRVSIAYCHASPVSAGAGPANNQITAAASAIKPTAGTNHAETRSAKRCTGAAEPCASSTKRITWASVVSAPTRVARMVNPPVPLMVPDSTASPADFSAGMLSPVRADSSTSVCPPMISPSTGICSPGRTANASLTAI